MLVFVDESGDLGFKFDRGSTRFFTLALVVFEADETAFACQQAIVKLKEQLGLPPGHEFHFHGDGHQRRLAFLSTVQGHEFSCYTLTLDKASPDLTGSGFEHKAFAYEWVCRIALENVAAHLENATVILDGSGEREFRRQLSTYLRQEMISPQRHSIRKVKVSRSASDPLVQLADYVASITNRLYEAKAGAELYDTYLRRKRRSQAQWP